jgi:hypothetical protein
MGDTKLMLSARKFPYIFSMHGAPASRARVGLTVYPPSRTLQLSAFDEKYTFDFFAFFGGM